MKTHPHRLTRSMKERSFRTWLASVCPLGLGLFEIIEQRGLLALEARDGGGRGWRSIYTGPARTPCQAAEDASRGGAGLGAIWAPPALCFLCVLPTPTAAVLATKRKSY